MRYFLSFLIVLFSFLESKASDKNLNEAFDKSLGRLNTIALLNEYIDSCALAQKVAANSKAEVFLVNDVIERKFYHGYSYYTQKDNFLAYLAGEYVWDHLSAIVLPDDIVKHGMAACSQQAMVMMEVLSLRGYKVRNLGLTGHYILEVFYDNAWHIFDPNHEPKYQGIPHDSLDAFLENGLISESYSRTLTPERVKEVFTNIQVGQVDAEPAKNARLFHSVTKAVSQYFILILIGFLLTLLYFFKKRKQKKLNSRLIANQHRPVAR
jgi:hypothetical protein